MTIELTHSRREIDETELDLQVIARFDAAENVVVLTLSNSIDHPLPAWQPGAHLDITVGDGTTRQFSLCGDPSDTSRYEIAVLKVEDGRGGSAYVHSSLHVGARVHARNPRNHFRFDDSPGYLFIAGGIGITPIVPMLKQAQERGADWRLIYCGRNESTMAFAEELAGYGNRVELWPSETRGRVDIARAFEQLGENVLVYCCGPARLLESVEEYTTGWAAGTVRTERFAAGELTEPVRAEGFEIHLESSGLTFTVSPEESILEVVENAGIDVQSSCGDGTCGTCESAVLSGEPDHRDAVLTPEEQAANDCMMICVSRAKCARLVLDL
ncbi:PDR/VanB family oxidoreductase [Rhodococcus qingshengii]|uniref:PDR/VanB family oxidoreductase n=1 Tax=Rhodococcus qingshengii TaxID=334542 RepID=UPI00237D2958|nr:PDR/VanB family oxidoreductase [Rhodococcus qingshengii]WCT05786.1 PDR/VanB family oxidoreductase [Rhodococcus qingshengii]